MFQRIVFSAVPAGVAAGLLITLIQYFTVIPIILEAETYESSALAADHTGSADTAHGHEAVTHIHDHDGWSPDDGIERTLYTALSNSLAAIGFALLLGAGFAIFNHADWRGGLLWGLGGFAAFQLAPAVGLPPELPGTAAAQLEFRQVWWVATAVATLGGLGALVFARHAALRLLGAILIIVPHIVGAPHPASHSSSVPPELAAEFATRTLLVGCVFWVALGGLTGLAYSKLK